MNGARRLLVALVLASLGGSVALAADAQIPADLAGELKSGSVGVVIVEVQFAKDGKAQKCRVLRSNAPYPLEVSTVDFIEAHWKVPLFSGEIRTMPIIFQEPPSYAPKWNGEMPVPPNPLAVNDPERNLKLRLTFGADGWVSRTEVLESSGLDSLDQDTARFVKVHWHHDLYANQVVDAPFDFKAPASPPPPPVPVEQHQGSPPPPPEPVAIPAIRAE